MTANIYVVDTSSMIALEQYPIDIFKSLWTNLEKLVKNNQLISPKEALEELKKKDDEIARWAKKNKKMFKTITQQQSAKVKEILAKFPALIDPNKETPDADPFLIALSLEKTQQQTLTQTQRVVVAQEVYRNNKINIPFVCQFYGVECIKLIDLFRMENWKF